MQMRNFVNTKTDLQVKAYLHKLSKYCSKKARCSVRLRKTLYILGNNNTTWIRLWWTQVQFSIWGQEILTYYVVYIHFINIYFSQHSYSRVSQQVSAHNFYNLFQQQQRPYNYIIFQYIPRALQCTCSSVPEASGCPQKKNVFGWAASHSCTTSFTPSSEVNRRPLKASLSRPKRW